MTITKKPMRCWPPGLSLTKFIKQVMHICIGNLTIIGSDNGLSPDQHQAIIWTYAVILLIRPLGTNFIENLIVIYVFSFKKMKILSRKWWPFGLGLIVLMAAMHYTCCIIWSMWHYNKIMTCSGSFHYHLKQYRLIVNCNFRNKSTNIFFA